MINWYCRDMNCKFKGKKLLHGFPRPVSGSQKSAISWMTSSLYSTSTDTFQTDNAFDAWIIDSVSERGQSSKIPQVALFIPDKNLYVQVDLRLDGLINILCKHGVTGGRIDVKVGIRFSGANYYVDELSSVPDIPMKPAKSSKKNSTVLVEGEYYSIDGTLYKYMGEYFSSTENIPRSISGKTYKFFLGCFVDRPLLKFTRSVSVSLIHSKRSNRQIAEYSRGAKIASRHATVGGYGMRTGAEVDTVTRVFKARGDSTNIP